MIKLIDYTVFPSRNFPRQRWQMRILRFTVPQEYDGAKGKDFLRRYCGLSYRLVVALKQIENGVTADGNVLRTIDRVKSGQTVEIRLSDEDESPQECAESGDAAVLYEDDDVLVFDKPAEMPVHPSKLHPNGTLANVAAKYSRSKGESISFRPINRLDRNTTGIVVTAKNSYAAAKLSGKTEKIYFAVIEGILEGKGTIDAPLRRKEGHAIQREIGEGGETAVTHWESIAVGEGHTLLKVMIETGRTHQIRAHFSSLGYPLAGDDMYGGSTDKISRHALHCAVLWFSHPVSSETVTVKSALPRDFADLLEKCKMVPPSEEYWQNGCEK